MSPRLAIAAVAAFAAAAGADTEQPNTRVLLLGPGDAFVCTATTGCAVMSPQLLQLLIKRSEAPAPRKCGPTI
jgi:hypothetical protein